MTNGKRKRAAPRKKVSFWATKEVRKPVKVSFRRSTGERVSFKATKKTFKPTKVVFYTKKRRRK